MITKIVSGGQTGADRGGLAAAIHCRLPHGGWCPKGRRAEDGTIPGKYQLQESPSANYTVRTEANVVDSDCTVVFTCGPLEGGSLKTAEFAKKHNRPWLHIDLSKMSRSESTDQVVQWLREQCPGECVLNVAGSRASKAPKIEGFVFVRMIDVISKVNGTLFYPLGDDTTPDDMDKPPEPMMDQMDETDDGKQAPTIELYHPKTVAEALSIIIGLLKPETKATICAYATADDFAADAHFGQGLWVRNSMIYQNQNRIELLADIQRGCREGKWQSSAEADDVSAVIVRQLFCLLKGQ